MSVVDIVGTDKHIRNVCFLKDLLDHCRFTHLARTRNNLNLASRLRKSCFQFCKLRSFEHNLLIFSCKDMQNSQICQTKFSKVTHKILKIFASYLRLNQLKPPDEEAKRWPSEVRQFDNSTIRQMGKQNRQIILIFYILYYIYYNIYNIIKNLSCFMSEKMNFAFVELSNCRIL